MALSVSLGALAAHALKAHLPVQSLESFQVGVRYQVYHSIAILALVALAGQKKVDIRRALNVLIIGMVFFSVSIYLLSTRSVYGAEGEMTWLGPITPLGGLLLIAGWCMLAFRFFRAEWE